MENIIEQVLELAKTDKKFLLSLKTAAVQSKQYELAAKFREMEKEIFPLTEEQQEAKAYGEQMSAAFRMVELKVNEPSLAWILATTVNTVERLQGEFAISDAIEIQRNYERLFEISHD